MKAKVGYKKKEHYVSQYILKRFCSKNNMIDQVRFNDDDIKRFSQNIRETCSENDFFEVKLGDGSYINRNRMEDRFEQLEDVVSKYIEETLEIVKRENSKQEIEKMINNGEWDKLTIYLMLHLTLTIVRTPSMKEIVFKNEKYSQETNHVFYNDLLWGESEAKILSQKLFIGDDKANIDKAIEMGENRGSINVFLNYLANNHYLELCLTPDNKTYYLTDSPVIVNHFSDIDYFLPLSPRIAMVLRRIPSDNYFISILPVLSSEQVDLLNGCLVKKADKTVIVQNMSDEDFEFIKKARSTTPF